MLAADRRRFLKASAATAAWAALPRPLLAAMGPNDKFDLLIRNANVLDPASAFPAVVTSASATGWWRRSRRPSPQSGARASSMPAAGW